MGNLIGIDIGGTKTAVVLGSEEAGGVRVACRAAFPTETGLGPRHALQRIYAEVARLLETCGGCVDGIGVSCGGPLDSRAGVILSPPNLPGWDDVRIDEELEARFGRRALLQNDANACALAEWRWGAAKGFDNAVFLTFGTGLGAGLILSGRLYEGACGMAGEAGHIRLAEDGPVGYGKAGSFEGFCSGGGIGRLAQGLARQWLASGRQTALCAGEAGVTGIDARLVAEAARAGDALALEVLHTSGRFLGRGLAVLVDLLNPDVIVIGSIFARCQDLLWPEAEKALRAESLGISADACRVLPAMLGEAIGDCAALAVAAGCRAN